MSISPESGWKMLRLDPDLSLLCQKGQRIGAHRKAERDKQHKEKHLRLERGEKPGLVNWFLRMASCHLKYSQRCSFRSSSEGSPTPTLSSRRRERECDGDNRRARSSGPRPSKNRPSHFESKSVPSLKLSPFANTQRGREAANSQFKATMLGARSNEDQLGMKISLPKYNVMKSEE